jgi:hypothetical protein
MLMLQLLNVNENLCYPADCWPVAIWTLKLNPLQSLHVMLTNKFIPKQYGGIPQTQEHAGTLHVSASIVVPPPPSHSTGTAFSPAIKMCPFPPSVAPRGLAQLPSAMRPSVLRALRTEHQHAAHSYTARCSLHYSSTMGVLLLTAR